MPELKFTVTDEQLELLKRAAAAAALPLAGWARSTLVVVARKIQAHEPGEEPRWTKVQLADFKRTMSLLAKAGQTIPSYLIYNRSQSDVSEITLQYLDDFERWARENGHLV